MQELLHLDQIENFTLVAKGYATDTRPVIMHTIGSFAQALLDSASYLYQLSLVLAFF